LVTQIIENMKPEVDFVLIVFLFIAAIFNIGLYFYIQQEYKIIGENLVRYDRGGKYDTPAVVVHIPSIEKIQKVEKNGKLKGLKIFRKGEDQAILFVKAKDVATILKDLREVNQEIKVSS